MGPAVTSVFALAMALSAFSGTAFAQGRTFEVEGQIRSVKPGGSDYVVKVMGTRTM